LVHLGGGGVPLGKHRFGDLHTVFDIHHQKNAVAGAGAKVKIFLKLYWDSEICGSGGRTGRVSCAVRGRRAVGVWGMGHSPRPKFC
jgi:hypothetical protein